MSYPKDPYYEKQPPVGGSNYYPNNQQMAQPESAQYLPPSYSSAPPPYSAVSPGMAGSALPQYQSSPYHYNAGVPPQAHGQPYAPGNMPGSAPPPYANYGQPNFNPGYPVQQNFNYAAPPMAVAQFDAGARFDGIASPKIPPPPPGCAPNAAQLASAQGGTVVASQKKAGWFSGTGGGVSFW